LKPWGLSPQLPNGERIVSMVHPHTLVAEVMQNVCTQHLKMPELADFFGFFVAFEPGTMRKL
jgi:hypothetical protein